MENIWPGINHLNQWAEIHLFDLDPHAADAKVKELIRKLAVQPQTAAQLDIINAAFGLPEVDAFVRGQDLLFNYLDKDRLILYYQQLIYLCVERL